MIFLFKTFSFVRFESLNQFKFSASFFLRRKGTRGDGNHLLRTQWVKGSGEVIRASAPYS